MAKRGRDDEPMDRSVRAKLQFIEQTLNEDDGALNEHNPNATMNQLADVIPVSGSQTTPPLQPPVELSGQHVHPYHSVPQTIAPPYAESSVQPSGHHVHPYHSVPQTLASFQPHAEPSGQHVHPYHSVPQTLASFQPHAEPSGQPSGQHVHPYHSVPQTLIVPPQPPILPAPVHPHPIQTQTQTQALITPQPPILPISPNVWPPHFPAQPTFPHHPYPIQTQTRAPVHPHPIQTQTQALIVPPQPPILPAPVHPHPIQTQTQALIVPPQPPILPISPDVWPPPHFPAQPTFSHHTHPIQTQTRAPVVPPHHPMQAQAFVFSAQSPILPVSSVVQTPHFPAQPTFPHHPPQPSVIPHRSTLIRQSHPQWMYAAGPSTVVRQLFPTVYLPLHRALEAPVVAVVPSADAGAFEHEMQAMSTFRGRVSEQIYTQLDRLFVDLGLTAYDVERVSRDVSRYVVAVIYRGHPTYERQI